MNKNANSADIRFLLEPPQKPREKRRSLLKSLCLTQKRIVQQHVHVNKLIILSTKVAGNNEREKSKLFESCLFDYVQ